MRVILIALAVTAMLAGCNNSDSGTQSQSSAPASGPNVSAAPVAAAVAPPAVAPSAVDADGVPAVCGHAIDAKRVCFDNAARKDDAEGNGTAATHTRVSADASLSSMMARWKARPNKASLQAECQQLLDSLKKIPACQPQ
jgi:hypothetical protein